jgi:hypothetical protein
MKISKPIPNGITPSSGSSHFHNTNIFVSGSDRASREPIFIGKLLKSDLAEYLTVCVVRDVQSILEVLDIFLMWLERYSLITS